MTQIKPTKELDMVFESLAHQHRRTIIYLLGLQPYSISQLAEHLQLSLPAIHKHIVILEKSNMVKRRKTGRVTYLTLRKESLRSLQDWLNQYHAYWGTSKETHENYKDYLSKKK